MENSNKNTPGRVPKPNTSTKTASNIAERRKAAGVGRADSDKAGVVPGSQIERSRIATVPAVETDSLVERIRARRQAQQSLARVETPAPAIAPSTPPPPEPQASAVEKASAPVVEATPATAKSKEAESAGRAVSQAIVEVKADLAKALNEIGDMRRSRSRERVATILAVAALGIGFVFSPRSAHFATSMAPLAGTRTSAEPAFDNQTTKQPRLLPARKPDASNLPAALAWNVERLSTVIESVGGGRPQGVLPAVRAASGSRSCPFSWSDGRISLIYEGEAMTMNSVNDSLGRCADAVELYRQSVPTDRSF